MLHWDGKLYAAGGLGLGGNYMLGGGPDTVEVYDPHRSVGRLDYTGCCFEYTTVWVGLCCIGGEIICSGRGTAGNVRRSLRPLPQPTTPSHLSRRRFLCKRISEEVPRHSSFSTRKILTDCCAMLALKPLHAAPIYMNTRFKPQQTMQQRKSPCLRILVS